MKVFFGFLLFACSIPLFSQQISFQSIHQEQSFYYSQFEFTQDSQFDSLNGITTSTRQSRGESSDLLRTVFGYHPYWMGTAYLEYRWDLISDLCYFSCEVDPYSGIPITVHNWLTAPVIDSAIMNGVNVHLCITLFEGHAAFFSSPVAQQALIDTAIGLVKVRDALGVNLDFEAVPSSLSYELNQFLIHFAQQFHDQLAGKMVSLAVPAVDWNETFDLHTLQTKIDLFMIMGYDYYWNGSSQAGPVDGLYSMVSGYDYNLSRTVSWYLSKGIPRDKLLLGLPYYGRQWPVNQQYAPSATAGWGTALTYYAIRNNPSGFYSNSNKHLENNSFSPYYSFQANGWNQCFINDVMSLGKRFDRVNQRGLAGIGIWALGYDHGYHDFWQLIRDKFTAAAPAVYQDTLYDSGGPAFSYYPGEDYLETIRLPGCEALHLTFLIFDLENGNDFLSVYNGGDTSSPLLGRYTGNQIPQMVTADNGALTLHFVSDHEIEHPGWKAIWHCGPMGIQDTIIHSPQVLIHCYPNPVTDLLVMDLILEDNMKVVIKTYNVSGRLTGDPVHSTVSRGSSQLIYHPRKAGIERSGLYLTQMIFENGTSVSFKWIYSRQ